MWKVGGARAAEGADLEQVIAAAQKAIDNTRSIGVGLSACTIPAVGKPNFSIEDGKMEVGIGHHGEPGVEVTAPRPAREMADMMLDHILPDLPFARGNDLAVLISGLGATPIMELYNLCPNVEFFGAPPFDGAMTGRLRAPRLQIVKLPPALTSLEAAMLEPLGVAMHAVDLAKPQLLERAVALGAGPIGLLIRQVLKFAGASAVYAFEPQAHRCETAIRLGAAAADETGAEIAGWSGGKGFSLVVKATNNPFGFRDAVQAARIGGRIVLVGVPDGDVYTLPAADARRRGLKIKFSRRANAIYPRAVELVASGRVDVASIVTHKVDLAAAPDVFRALADSEPGLGKVLICPNGRRSARRSQKESL